MFNTKKAFTLIELLVVISIIALLMSIMMPALSRVRAQAQTTVCATNLKNYGTALHAYAADNSGRAPFMLYWLYSKETLDRGVSQRVCHPGCRWHYDGDEPDGSMWGYLKNEKVHMCPTFKSYTKSGECPNPSHSSSTPYNPMYSYSMNYFLGFDWSTGLAVGFSNAYADQISMRLSRVKNASGCFSFSEENTWAIRADSDNPREYSVNCLNDNALWMNANPAKEDGATDNFATYHNVGKDKKNEGFADAAFVDGHVERVQGKRGRDAYLEYGRPYKGHESMNVW